MIERFKDRRLLISALKKQTIIANDQKLAEIIADKVELIQFNEDEVLINEEAEDNDLYFILIGSVVITIHQREIAIRKANQHIGELSLIDPSAKRSATIRVNELSVFAKISEPNFSLISIKHINLWRNIAIEIGDRLRQRNRFIFPPNPRPQVFIGCSTESLQIAQAIQSGLTHDDFNVKIWTDGVFKPSTFPIEALEDYIIHADFGILVVTPDDIIELRGRSDPSARDNVIFELGVCMGGLSRRRTFMVKPRGANLHIPSDLIGIKALEYKVGPENDFATALGPVCSEIRTIINILKMK